MDNGLTSRVLDLQLVEYQAAQECYLHYDSFRWQAGSLLIAGAFVFWGLIFSTDKIKDKATTIGLLSLLVALLMTVWVLFASHYRQIYLYKLHRIHQLESDLNMVQHRRFGGIGEYRVFGIKGHNLDLLMYAFVSLGGPFVGVVVAGFDASYLLTASLVAVGIFWFLVNEHRVKAQLKRISPVP